MMKVLMCSVTAAALVGCASSGGSGGGSVATGLPVTQFSSPSQFSPTEFKTEPKKYSKQWVNYNGGGVDSFKKITIPAYTLQFQKHVQKVTKNKMAALLASADGAKSELTMNVAFPWEKNQALLQEITNESYARLKEKFKSAGVELVEWNEMKQKYPEAVEFEKDKFVMEPVAQGDTTVSFSAPGLARLNSAMWAFGASSLSRESKVSIIIPNFAVGYGYFGGEKTPYTISEAHGMTDVQFTPQLQVFTGSGFGYHSKWDSGIMVLDRTMVTNEPFVTKLEKGSDSRAAAKSAEDARRNMAMAATGAESYEVKTSSRASLDYSLAIDPVKYKKAVLAQLDAAEDVIVERYKNEF